MTSRQPRNVADFRAMVAQVANEKSFGSANPDAQRNRARAGIAASKLPDGKTCGECCNYLTHCKMVFQSNRGPLDPNMNICAYTPSKFDDPLYIEGRLAWRFKR